MKELTVKELVDLMHGMSYDTVITDTRMKYWFTIHGRKRTIEDDMEIIGKSGENMEKDDKNIED